MSEKVDNRVVNLKFNNQDFAERVESTVGELGRLKKGLDLEESAKNLENLQRTGNSFSLAGISSGVETIAGRFSNLGIMGVTALQNIANSAVNTGKQMLRSLTVEPILSGFQLYETKINSIQTILTNTASKGTKMSDVTAALADLNKYANLTIYNFQDMAKNVGTFTAAGLSLKDSVQDIKGIANLGAGSGSTPEQVSMAMYQLSQALASGKVQLQDWNSVVNAGMGGEMFQNALVKTARSMGKVVNMSNGFRASLDVKKGSSWLTSDVLSKTLAQFADNKSLVEAATQVRTFTQLWDVMKESIQSGWGESWENIIGGKDEAVNLLTNISNAFGNMIQPSEDARNAMLKFWHDNGGRDAMIKALSNAFAGLESVIKPVKEGFKEIFPPMTGQRLTEISVSLEKVTTGLKMGDKDAQNLKNTFKGAFAILDIFKQGLEAIGKLFFGMTKSAAPAASGVLSFTGSIGSAIVEFDKFIKTSDVFNKAVQKIQDFMKPVVDGVKNGVKTIADTFNSLTNVDMTGLTTFSQKVQARFEPFEKLADLVGAAFQHIANIVAKVAPVFFALGSMIGRALHELSDKIVNAFNGANYSSIFDVINGGMMTGILVGLKKFIDSLTKLSKNAGSIKNGIVEILGGVKDVLKAYQSQIKSKTLLQIAEAMGILALSLMVIASINSDKLTSSLGAMSLMFLELFGSMGVFEKVMGSDSFKGIPKVVASMIGVGVAVLILSDAMTKLAKLDWDGITKGLIGVGVLTATLVKAASALSENEGKVVKGATGFILFAVAIDVLATAVKKLGSLTDGELENGLIGVGVLVAELAAFMKVTDVNKMGIRNGAGLLIFAAGIDVLAIAVKKLGALSDSSLEKGLLGIGTLLAELALFLRTTGDSKGVIATAVGLTILAAAMNIFAEAVKKLGALTDGELENGLIGMAVTLAEVTLALKLMPKNIVGTGFALVEVATALVIMSQAVKTMGSMSWESIAKGLIVLAGSLGIIAVAMKFMTGALPGAAALLVVSAALAILAPVLKVLGSMGMMNITQALIMLAGTFAVLGVAGYALAPVIPTLLALAGVIALIGVGALAVGAGLLLFSAGLTALGVALSASGAGIVVFVSGILGLIPFAFQMVGQGIIALASVLAGAGPTLTAAATTLILSLCQAIVTCVPAITGSILILVTTLLAQLAAAVPQMVDSGMAMIEGILKGVADHIGEIAYEGVEIIANFVNGIAAGLPDIIQSAFNLIISFINGLADAINNNYDAIYNVCDNLIQSIINAIVGLIPHLFGIGGKIVDGIMNGIRGAAKGIQDGAQWLGNKLIGGLKGVLGIHSPSVKGREIGSYFVQGFVNGIIKLSDAAKTAAENVGRTALTSLSDAISNASDNAVNGDITPTIRPVIDLTDVKAGQKSINSMFDQAQSINLDAQVARAESINQSGNDQNQNGSQVKASVDKLLDYFKNKPDPQPQNNINFNGNYSFSNQKDIDYFMNEAALRIGRKS